MRLVNGERHFAGNKEHMSREIQDKRIVVTGSSRGLGRAFACALAAEGAQLVINGTDEEALAKTENLIASLRGTSTSVLGSVADTGTCEQLIERCVDTYGGIDVLVNNAGIVRDRTLLKMSAEEFDDVIAVNLRGAWACTKFAAQRMSQADGGHIVQIISASGLVGGFGQGNYAASKAGMMGLLRTAVLEFQKFNVRCNALWPVAQTDMTQVVFERAEAQARAQGAPPPDRQALGFGIPDEVAVGLLWLVSDRGNHLNGQVLSYNGRKVALWTHPSEYALGFRDTPWTLDAMDQHFKDVAPAEIYRARMSS